MANVFLAFKEIVKWFQSDGSILLSHIPCFESSVPQQEPTFLSANSICASQLAWSIRKSNNLICNNLINLGCVDSQKKDSDLKINFEVSNDPDLLTELIE